MTVFKAVLIFVGAVLLGFVAAGIVLSHFRFFIWIGIIGLIIYGIAALVVSRRSD
jgi:hypothetical protein